MYNTNHDQKMIIKIIYHTMIGDTNIPCYHCYRDLKYYCAKYIHKYT